MTSIYISSTFSDLVKHREAVAHALRKMRKLVVAMEDYTASDDRPLDKCLADVARCDIYVGIFAHRYGFVPNHDNPEGLSITELELKEATDKSKTRLIFVVDESASWQMPLTDYFTGEGDQGRKIKSLRARLRDRYLVSEFSTADDLAKSVTIAVSNVVEVSPKRPESDPATQQPMPREISSGLFLTYLDVDSDLARDIHSYCAPLRVQLDPRALLSTTLEDFKLLDQNVCSCHSGAVLVSDGSLRQLKERSSQVKSIFRMLSERTGHLLALCTSSDCLEELREWPVNEIESVAGWHPLEADAPKALHNKLLALGRATTPDLGNRWGGLPVIVVAMTKAEAQEITSDPLIVSQRLGQSAHTHFTQLTAAMTTRDEGRLLALDRYGSTRYEFRPFTGNKLDVRTLLNTTIDRLNDERPAQLRGRLIKLQYYSMDELIQNRADSISIFNQLSSTGCVLILDEYSLFHPDIQEALTSSGLLANEMVSLVTLSPSNPYSSRPFDLLEDELRQRMTVAVNRFSPMLDPQCELSVGDEKRLKRWLSSSIPFTIQSLRDPKPIRKNILQFAKEQGIDPQQKFGSLLYSEGGIL